MCKSKECNNAPNGMNGFCHDCTESGLNSLLKRLQAEPLAKERQEFGQILMRHIDDLTPSEKIRYNELKEILNKQ